MLPYRQVVEITELGCAGGMGVCESWANHVSFMLLRVHVHRLFSKRREVAGFAVLHVWLQSLIRYSTVCSARDKAVGNARGVSGGRESLGKGRCKV